ncbi:hypothetical protein pEaSNUABM49_00080 [Erwinia phage pEa_SNUABM_49]|nr:hypothetical protein pEaSNUABM49_00080 [Erwinia phage pEa_SNUABM_49]
MLRTIYLFYYTSYEIVDHDEDGAVYSNERNDLGAFYDFQTGLEYYQHMYPSKQIQYQTIQIMDSIEE